MSTAVSFARTRSSNFFARFSSVTEPRLSDSDARETAFAKSAKSRNFTTSNSALSGLPVNIGAHSFQNDHSQSSSTLFSLFLHSRDDFSPYSDSFFLFSFSPRVVCTLPVHCGSKRAGARGTCVRRRPCVRRVAARVVATSNTRAPNYENKPSPITNNLCRTRQTDRFAHCLTMPIIVRTGIDSGSNGG